jgi:hypothetical protein
MKTIPLFLLSILTLLFAITKTNAQATTASNAIVSTNYLGSANDVDVLFKRNNVFAGMLATTSISLGVNSSAGLSSVSIGAGAGQFSSGSGSNTYVGQNAGKGSSSALNTGSGNTFIGLSSGINNTNGEGNTYLGNGTGYSNDTGNHNVIIGAEAGSALKGGNNNTIIGYRAGREAEAGSDDYESGSNNVFIGTDSGSSENGSNTLVIDNGTRGNVLIWGDFAASQLKFHSKVGIGGNGSTAFGNFPTTAGGVNVSNYNLFVKGGILTEEVRVSLQSTWADYVFLKDYKLPTLEEVEAQIKEKGYLRNVPSAKEIKANGIELGEMSKIQQEKIEELTLYIIEQNKVNQAQNKEIAELKTMLKTILEKTN